MPVTPRYRKHRRPDVAPVKDHRNTQQEAAEYAPFDGVSLAFPGIPSNSLTIRVKPNPQPSQTKYTGDEDKAYDAVRSGHTSGSVQKRNKSRESKTCMYNSPTISSLRKAVVEIKDGKRVSPSKSRVSKPSPGRNVKRAKSNNRSSGISPRREVSADTKNQDGMHDKKGKKEIETFPGCETKAYQNDEERQRAYPRNTSDDPGEGMFLGGDNGMSEGEDSLCMKTVGFMGDIDFKLEKPRHERLVIESISSLTSGVNCDRSLSEMVSLIHKPDNDGGQQTATMATPSRLGNRVRTRSRSRTTTKEHATLDRMFADVFKNLVIQHSPDVTEDSYTATVEECMMGAGEEDSSCHLEELESDDTQVEALHGVDGNNCHLSQGYDESPHDSSLSSESPFGSKEDINSDAQGSSQCQGVQVQETTRGENRCECGMENGLSLNETACSTGVGRLINAYPPDSNINKDENKNWDEDETAHKIGSLELTRKTLIDRSIDAISSETCNEKAMFTRPLRKLHSVSSNTYGYDVGDAHAPENSSLLSESQTRTMNTRSPRLIMSRTSKRAATAASNKCHDDSPLPSHNVGSETGEQNCAPQQVQTPECSKSEPSQCAEKPCPTSSPDQEGDHLQLSLDVCESILASLVQSVASLDALKEDNYHVTTSYLDQFPPKVIRHGSRKNSSCHEDLPSASQSLSCDVAHSETNVSEVNMAAIVSQEVNIRRYPSCNDLTELHDDDDDDVFSGVKSLGKAAALTQNPTQTNTKNTKRGAPLKETAPMALPGVSRQDSDSSLRLPSPPTDSLELLTASPLGSNSLDNVSQEALGVMESLSGCVSHSSSLSSPFSISRDVNQSNQSGSLGYYIGIAPIETEYRKGRNTSDMIQSGLGGFDTCATTDCRHNVKPNPSRTVDVSKCKKTKGYSIQSSARRDVLKSKSNQANIKRQFTSGEIDSNICTKDSLSNNMPTMKNVKIRNKKIQNQSRPTPQRCHRDASLPHGSIKKWIRDSKNTPARVKRARTVVVTSRYTIRGPSDSDTSVAETCYQDTTKQRPLLSIEINDPVLDADMDSVSNPSSATLRCSGNDNQSACDRLSTSSSDTLTQDITFVSSSESISISTPCGGAANGRDGEEVNTMNSSCLPPNNEVPPKNDHMLHFVVKSTVHQMPGLRSSLNTNSNRHCDKTKNMAYILSAQVGTHCSTCQTPADVASCSSWNDQEEGEDKNIAQKEDMNTALLADTAVAKKVHLCVGNHREVEQTMEAGALPINNTSISRRIKEDISRYQSSWSEESKRKHEWKTTPRVIQVTPQQNRHGRTNQSKTHLTHQETTHETKYQTLQDTTHDTSKQEATNSNDQETTPEGKKETTVKQKTQTKQETTGHMKQEPTHETKQESQLQTSPVDSSTEDSTSCTFARADRVESREKVLNTGTKNAIFNFANRSQYHVDKCDQILARSNRLIGHSEALVESSRRQLDHVTRCLDRELPVDDGSSTSS